MTYTVRNMQSRQTGFTLIELIVVIAILGILYTAIFPALSAVRRAAMITKSEIQFEKYADAIYSYYVTYGDLPGFMAPDTAFNLEEGNNAQLFIQALANRNENLEKIEYAQNEFNTKGISFCEFSDDDFYKNANGSINHISLADAFNNTNITIIAKRLSCSRFDIATEHFPDDARQYIHNQGVNKQVAIYSINNKNNIFICNWQKK